jgi:DNA-directed RNA polymerase subunit alpha
VDGLFMPIKRVNYKIKIINDTKGNLKESLLLEIWTNGSISPKRSIQEAIKVLMNLFYPLFLSTQFRSLSSTITSTNEDEKIVSKTIFLSPLEKKKIFKMNGTKNNK